MFLCSDIKLFLLISYDITQTMISDISRSQSGFLSILKLTINYILAATKLTGDTGVRFSLCCFSYL